MIRPLFLASIVLAGLPMAALAAPRVVTDLPPVGALVAQVMQGVGAPEVLLSVVGDDGHHHQLRPSQARQVASADLLVWMGPQMTPWLDAAAEALAPGQGLALLDLPETRVHDASGHADDDHGHGAIDPHAWLDPGNAQAWLGVIAETLAAQDPDNAATYRENAAEGRAAIDAAVTEARALLKGHDSRFVVAHDALGYFTEAMDLPPALALADLTDSAPSAGVLRRLRREIAASDATCMHLEAGMDPRVFASLDGLGLQMGAPLDILGMTLGEVGPDLYPALLIGLARGIADCPSGP